MKTVVLASASPRRKEILERARIPFIVDAGDYEEDMSLDLPPHELVRHFSLGKAQSVQHKHPNSLVIGSDSVVVFDGKILGKPHTPQRAKEMLQKLSGRKNTAVTGYAVIDTDNGNMFVDSVENVVTFRKISDHEIDAYIATGEPFDKAGAYAIQGVGGLFVEKIEGDYTAILGLPLWPVVRTLKEFGFEPFQI